MDPTPAESTVTAVELLVMGTYNCDPFSEPATVCFALRCWIVY